MTITQSIGSVACAAVVAVGAAKSLRPPAVAAAAVANDEIHLSGCLIRGDGNDEYLLTNWPADPALSSADTRVSPSAVGTTSGYSTVFYWLYDHDELKKHVGHRVEVKGDVKGDIHDGEIKLERKDNWTELTVKADGRTLKANVPNTSFAPGDESERKGHVMVRRVDVGHVTMLGANCQL